LKRYTEKNELIRAVQYTENQNDSVYQNTDMIQYTKISI